MAVVLLVTIDTRRAHFAARRRIGRLQDLRLHLDRLLQQRGGVELLEALQMGGGRFLVGRSRG